MHAEAFAFVRGFATNDAIDIIDVGARDINGSCRPLFPNARYIGLDLHPGPAVDVVCDAATYQPANKCDLVLICEVLEHAANWRELIRVAASWLRPDGRLIVTCAAPGREPHSAIDGEHRLLDGEHYENLTADEVADAMRAAGLGWIEAEQGGEDTQAMGWMPGTDTD